LSIKIKNRLNPPFASSKPEAGLAIGKIGSFTKRKAIASAMANSTSAIQ
jgi:hypothetical protein